MGGLPQDPGSGADLSTVPETPQKDSAFDLPEKLPEKAAPALIADDEQHFAAIAASLESTIGELTARLDATRKAPARMGQELLERDEEVRRLTSRIRTLGRYGLDLCLGHMVATDGEVAYIGRLGLTDAEGGRLLLDWRSPAAEPFFGATHANPMGLESRRRYRWTRGRVSDYWDEVFSADAIEGHAALDDQSAFIASLGGIRSDRMRDVLGTIQSDQDAIIRAGSRGALVVDGGPGTGKTVVALHRTAYLLYSDPRLGHNRGGGLFVGPHQPYLSYVSDVLPSLGEEGVQICTLRDLVEEGSAAVVEGDAVVASLKASARLVSAIEPAVALYEEPPTKGTTIETPWADVWVSAPEWSEAFGAAEPGLPHNEARDQVWDALLEILVDKLRDEDEDVDDSERDTDQFDAYGLNTETADDRLRRSLAANRELVRAFGKAWPVLDASDIVGQLWSVPALLRRCAPWLTPLEVDSLQRATADAWTVSDLPFLDAARQRLGDPDAALRRRRQAVVAVAERAHMSEVVADLIATDDSDMKVMSMLRGQDLRAALVDDAALPAVDPDLLAGPFAHIVVDEAQELTDAEWQMLLQRCPSRSFTIVGDRAQARHGFTESWEERLRRVGFDEIAIASLTINYRTPSEIMEEAAPVILAVLPDANVPVSIRSSGLPVVHGVHADLERVLADWDGDGIACVIGDPTFVATDRVRSLTPETAKGLEFDLVVLVESEPVVEPVETSIEQAVDRYVSMTRATQQLVILRS